MPESVCVQCHPDLAAAYKAKGDWCAEHGLPDSQCFKHHPELKEKFIAEFKAKTNRPFTLQAVALARADAGRCRFRGDP